MNEKERAERLARAIDDLLGGDRSMEAAETQPAGLEEEEVAALLRIAKVRLDEGAANVHDSIRYEGAVWQQVLYRLDRHEKNAQEVAAAAKSGDTINGFAAEEDFGELADIVRLRRQMGAEAMAIAEAHRESVWQQLQSRLDARSRRSGLLGLLKRTATVPAEVVPDFLRVDPSPVQTPQRGEPLWPRLAGFGAAAATIIAALGPIPATGLAGHPAVEFARYVGNHVGVAETNSPPSDTGDAIVIEGTSASAAEASALIGVTVTEPMRDPAGFAKTSSRVFSSGLSADGGLFVLTYDGTGTDSTSLAIYQERASGNDFAAQIGHAFDMPLRDGTPATYVEGFWQPVGGTFTWRDGDGQALIFEKDGVRTIIQYSGPNRDLLFLFDIAEGLAQP